MIIATADPPSRVDELFGCLVIDYDVMLDEESDPIEVIMDFEFGLQTEVNAQPDGLLRKREIKTAIARRLVAQRQRCT